MSLADSAAALMFLGVVAYGTSQPRTVSGTTDSGAWPDEANFFNRRWRYKAGAEAIYTFLSWMGCSLRVDGVRPNSRDHGEDFLVLAPRLYFRSHWVTHENIVLTYGKWFYGPRTHAEGSSLIDGDVGLDDQLIAVNVNMWW